MIPTPPFQSVASPLSDGSQPGPIGASLAGTGNPVAGRPASFLSDDPWLAAWRESQHGPGYDMDEEVR